MKKLLFSLAFVSVSLMSIAQVITPFTVRYNTTQKGGIVFLANTAAGCGAGTTLCQSKTCVQAHAEDPLTGVAVDNDFVATYVDVDNDPSTWMSSSDSLNLPSCSTISFAGLFWGAGGSTSSSTDPDGVHWATRTHVKIKLNNGNYQDLTADYSQDNTTGYHSYHCYKNITNIVAAAGANGRYTLANMPLLNDNGTTKNRWGGWQIVIVYKNELQTLRNLTVFNGLANVSGTTATNIPISGFLTPLTGPVNFELGVLAYDGDRGYNTGSGTSNSSCATTYRGDSLKFKGATSFVAITDLIHPSNDVFNSTISYNGVLTPFRNPSYSNTLGHDANIFVPNNSAKNYIGNSATSATIRETTGGETILSQVITSAIDVYEPDLHGSLAVRDLNGGAVQPGDTLEYIMTVANYGSDPSIHTYLTDTLGVNAVYVPNSIRISYGPNIGNKTDASGDDQVDYFSVSNAIRVRVGTTASSTLGGAVVNSSTGSDSTQIRFRVTATLNCTSLLCNNTINNRFWIYGTGQTSGDLLKSGSNPILVDSHGCPIPGTTKTIINASACSGPTTTNNSPVCAGESINLNVSAVVGATSYIWTGPNGYYSNVQNTVITNSTVAMSGTYTVTIYSNPGCAYSLTTNVIVNAAPDVNSVSNQIVCNNGSTTPIAFSGSIVGTSYNWTNSNAAIGLAASGSGNIASFTALNSGSSPVISTISVTPTLSGCIAGSSNSFTITVNPTPTVSASSTSQNICSGAAPSINLSSNVSGTTFNWAVVQSGVSGASAGSGSLIGQTLSTISNVAGTAVYTITPSSNNCIGSPIIVTINVKPLPTLTTTVASQSLCSGTTASISLTSNVLGAGFDWTVVQTGVSGAAQGTGASINQTLNTSGSNSGTAIYTITPSASNCVGSSVSESITVNPIPVAIASPSSQIICSGSSNAITLSSDVSGASFAWTVSQSGVSGTANGNGASISQTLSTIGTSSGTAQYTITPTANNCVGSSFTASSTVNPIPNVTATPTTQTICSGTAPSISLSSGVTGTSFTWTVVQNGVTGATSGSGSAISQILTSTANVAGNVVYTITPTANNCSGASTVVTINVNPIPVVTATPSTQTICSGGTTSISLSSNVSGASFSWTVLQTGVSGATSGSGNTIAQVLSASGNVQGSAIYTVTPLANSCNGVSLPVTIFVNPTPSAIATPSSQSICSGANSSIALSSNVSGAGFNWTVVQSGVTGATSGSGTSIAQTLTASSNVTGTAIYTITPSSNSCTGNTASVSITVKPIPSIAALPSSQTVCSGTAPNIVLSSNVVGSSFSWTVSQSGVTGASSGNGSNIGQVLSTSGISSGTAIYSITPSANSCNGSILGVTVSVNPLPTVSASPSSQSICSGTSPNISLSSNLSGASFNWSVVQTGVTGATSGNGSSISQTLLANGNTAGTAVYTVTPSANNCSGTASNVSITVKPTPIAIATPSSQMICSGTAPNISLSSNVSGTNFSWTVIQNGVSGASSGNGNSIGQTLTSTGNTAGTAIYSIIPTSNGCSGSPISVTITVNPSIIAAASPTSQTICSATSSNIALSSNVSGTNFDWTVVQSGVIGATSGNGNSISQTIATTGSTFGTAVYSITPSANGCSSSPITVSINVNPIPTINNVTSQTLCNGQHTALIGFSGSSVNGTTYHWSNDQTSIGLLGNGVGNIGQFTAINTSSSQVLATITVTPIANNCSGLSTSFTIAVNPTPSTPTATSNSPICFTSTVNLNTSTVANATYYWTGPNGFTSNLQSPNITNSTSLMGGNYLVTTTVDGCVSLAGTVSLITNNCVPSANFDTYIINEDSNNNFSVLLNDIDPQGNLNTSSMIITVAASNGTAIVGAGGVINYVPNYNFNGTDILVYQICDNTLPSPFCDTAIVYITVLPVNDSPVADDISLTTFINTPIGINVGAAVSDPENDPISFTYSTSGVPNGTSVMLSGNGSIVVTPPTGYIGTFTIPYTACDNSPYLVHVLCDNGIITITVIDTTSTVNHPPVANNDLAFTLVNIPLTINPLANDFDVDGNALTVSITSGPSHGSATLNPNGTVHYVPSIGFTGNDTIHYMICDNGSPILCANALIVVFVNPNKDYPNLPPYATDDFATTPENTLVNISVLSNDSDPNGDLLNNPTILSSPLNGTLVLNGNGSVSYIPNPNFNGTDSFIYSVCDSGTPSLCDTAVVTIHILPVNNAPTATDLSVTTFINTPIGVNVGSAVSDPENDPISFSYNTSGVPLGTIVSITGTGAIVVIPPTGYLGVFTIPYTSCDSSPFPINTLCSTGIITVNVIDTIGNINHPPFANNDLAFTLENTMVTINPLANDFDVDGNSLSISLISGPSHGTASLNANGTVTYSPASGFYGNDTITYMVCDDGTPSLCSNALIIITVSPVKDFPNLSPYAVDDFATALENTIITINVLGNDSDPDGNTIGNPTIISAPNHGSASVNINGTISYIPFTNYNGYDTLIYSICDNGSPSLCDTAVVIIHIVPGNNPPIAGNISVTTFINTAIGVNVGSVVSDPENDPISYSYNTSGTPTGTVVNITGNGTLVVIPPTGYLGTFVIPFTACDNSPYPVYVLCDNGTITVTVIDTAGNSNHPPLANDDYLTILVNTSAVVNALANDFDVDGNSLSLSIIGGSANGTVSLNTNGTVTYSANSGFIGNDTIYYTVCDNGVPSLCDNAMIVITVTPVVDVTNLPPFAVDDFATTAENTSVVISVLTNDSDPNGNSLNNPTVSDNPQNGTVSINGNGTLTYTPNTGFFGNDTLSYSVCDNGTPSLCDTAVVIVHIAPSSPVINSNSPVCEFNTINLFTPTLVNANYNWTGPNGFVSSIQNPSITNASLSMAGTYSLTITSTENGLTSGFATINVVVYPQQSAAFSYSSGTFCQSGIDPVPVITGTLGGTFTASPVGLEINSSDGTITAGSSTVGTYTVTYYTPGPCADTMNVSLSISSPFNATFTYSGSQYCQNASQNPLPIFGGTPGIFLVSPLGLNFVDINSGEINLATSTPGTYIVYNTIAASGGCASEIDSAVVTINPTPTVNSLADQIVCNNSNIASISLNGDVAGTSFDWTNSDNSIGLFDNGNGDIPTFVAINNGVSVVVSIITITPSANGCIGANGNFTLTVNPTPNTNIVANQVVCNNMTTTDVNISGGVVGTNYSWVNNHNSIGLNSNGSGDIASFIATNAGTNPEVATITISSEANGCVGSSSNFTITVNPTPSTSILNDQIVCNNSNTTTVNFTGGVTGTSFGWVNDNTSIGLSSSGNGDIGSFSAINLGANSEIATVIVTPSVNNCSGTSSSFTITVNPTPVVSMSANQTLCNGDYTMPVIFSGSFNGTNYSWTNDNTSIGLAALGNGDISSFTAVNNGLVSENANISVTPEANGCFGTNSSFTLTVNPSQFATFSYSSGTYCQSGINPSPSITGTQGGTFSSSPSGLIIDSSTGTITAAASGIGTYVVTYYTAGPCADTTSENVTISSPFNATFNYSSAVYCQFAPQNPMPIFGGSAGVFSSTPSGINFVNITSGEIDLTSSQPGTYTIYNTISASGGCSSELDSAVITINAAPIVSVSASANTICSGSSVTLTGTGATSYSWTGGVSDGVSFIPSTTDSYTVTGTDGNGCINTSTISVTVNSLPTVGATASSLSVCSGSSVTLTGTGANSYSWTGGVSDGVSFIPSTTDSYTVTGTDGNGCINSSTVTVSVTTIPTVDLVSDQTICNGASTLPINFTGIVAGTSFDWVNSDPSIGLSSSGTGNIASFISSNSGNSIVTAIITVTPNLNGCLGNSTNFNIVVNPTPNVNMILDQSVCNSTVIAPIVFAGTASIYNWTNSNTAIGLGASGTGNIPSFTATNNGTTSISAIISVSPSANGCTGNTMNFTITVNPTPVTPIASSNTPVCEGGSINLTSTAAIGADINWSGPNSYTSNSQNPVISPATLSMSGTYSVTVTNSLTGCVSAAGTTIVTVNPLPNSPIASSNSPVCLGDSIIFSTTVVTGAIYTWNGPGFSSSFQNPIIPSASIGMAGTYSLVITANGCTSVPSTVQVVINNCYGVDLSVTKTVNNIHPLVGNNVVFTIVVTNNGPNEATNVVVTDLLPSGYSYVSSTTTVGTYNNSTGLWTVGTIVNNGSETLTVTATVNPTGNYLNTASVTGDGVDPNNFNNASSVETLPEVLSIPEGFSPNGDGVNDVYVIKGIENYPNNTFVIFNRWGNKVYQANPYQNTWDGNSTTGLRVGGDQLPIGTYFFVLDLGDGTTPYKGTIYLNR